MLQWFDIGGGILCNKIVICHYRASTLYDTILTASRSANLTLMAHVIPMCYGVFNQASRRSLAARNTSCWPMLLLCYLCCAVM